MDAVLRHRIRSRIFAVRNWNTYRSYYYEEAYGCLCNHKATINGRIRTASFEHRHFSLIIRFILLSLIHNLFCFFIQEEGIDKFILFIWLIYSKHIWRWFFCKIRNASYVCFDSSIFQLTSSPSLSCLRTSWRTEIMKKKKVRLVILTIYDEKEWIYVHVSYKKHFYIVSKYLQQIFIRQRMSQSLQDHFYEQSILLKGAYTRVDECVCATNHRGCDFDPAYTVKKKVE